MNLLNKKSSAFLLGLSALTLGTGYQAEAKKKKEDRPNYVVIMCDDVSFDMFGCYGNTKTKTPNIDRLAQQGVKFNTAWNSAICGPARAQIMTGRYATKTGFWYNAFSLPQADGSNDMFKYHTAFSKILKDNGYQTAVAGKWHIGGSEHQDNPILGFDEYCMWEGVKEYKKLTGKKWLGGIEIPKGKKEGDPDKTARYWNPCIIQNHKVIETGSSDFGPDIFTNFICDFIAKASKKDEPFLAYYPMTLPHGPYVEMPTRTKQGSNLPNKDSEVPNEQRFEEMVDYIDILVGRIIKQVEKSGELDNTIFLFTADNGTAVTAKSRGIERGSQIPFIMAGKGIKQRGSTNEICDATDVLPTLVDLAHADYPKNFSHDGVSLKPFLEGSSDKHKDVIHACIGSTQLLRTRTHLLEVVNPILGLPYGRFYYCGDSHDGTGYLRAEENPEHQKVLNDFMDILENKYIGLKKDHPYLKTKRGKRFMKGYTKDKTVQKHIHNHRNYQRYDESVVFDESTMWTND